MLNFVKVHKGKNNGLQIQMYLSRKDATKCKANSILSKEDATKCKAIQLEAITTVGLTHERKQNMMMKREESGLIVL